MKLDRGLAGVCAILPPFRVVNLAQPPPGRQEGSTCTREVMFFNKLAFF
jgi:hypothetical protein